MKAITKTVILDGKKVEFPRLDVHDIISLGEEITLYREQKARKLGETEKLDKYEIINLCLQVTTRKVLTKEILAECESPGTATNVCTKSLLKAGISPVEAKGILSKMEIPDVLQLAVKLVIDEQEEAVTTEKESPLSENPVTSV